jgi:hypothetical protein
MKRALTGVAAFLAFVVLTGCGGGGDAPPLTGSVRIDRIMPATTPSGTATTFTIDVTYDLQSIGSAVIGYCFAPLNSMSCTFEPDIQIVDATKWTKSGTIIYTTTKTLLENHYVMAFLFEYPMQPGDPALDLDSAFIETMP